MIISDNPKFICFQPWKCGSTTLYRRLEKFDNKKYPQGAYFNEVLGKNSHKHINLADFAKLPESEDSHVRFTFVRNPYDRLYSGFSQRRDRLKSNPPKNIDPDALRRELSLIERGFGAFLPYYLELRGTYISLSNYVFLDGTPAVDFVGFVETFESSFSEICERVGLKGVGSGNSNVQYSQTNVEQTKAQFRYLDKFDPDTLHAVNEVFAEDFERLGYRMVRPSDLEQVKSGTIGPFTDTHLPVREESLLVLNRTV